MAIGKGSRVEFKSGDSTLYGLVRKVVNDAADVVVDDGRSGKIKLRSLKESANPLPDDHPLRRYKNGDRILFMHGKQQLLGRIREIDMFGLMQIDCDDGSSWKGVSAVKVRPNSTPLPEHMKIIPSQLVKGDRVEFKGDNGETLYGVVSKGGKRVEVVQDGGSVVHSGSCSIFRKSDHPLRKGPPDEMDRWSVVSYKANRRLSEETECFEAVIALDGRRIIQASNRGQGGSDEFHEMPGASRDALIAFEKDAEAWLARCDPETAASEFREPASDWLKWSVHAKDYGVTASEYFEKLRRDLEEMDAVYRKIR